MATKKRKTSRRRSSRKAAARRSSRRRVSRRRTSRRRVSRNKAKRRTSRRTSRAASNAKRLILRVKPYHRKETNGWAIVKSGRKTPMSFHRMKSVAMKKASRMARAEWKKGRKSQVVFYKRDGRIQGERTYGHDPRPVGPSGRRRNVG